MAGGRGAQARSAFLWSGLYTEKAKRIPETSSRDFPGSQSCMLAFFSRCVRGPFLPLLIWLSLVLAQSPKSSVCLPYLALYWGWTWVWMKAEAAGNGILEGGSTACICERGDRLGGVVEFSSHGLKDRNQKSEVYLPGLPQCLGMNLE